MTATFYFHKTVSVCGELFEHHYFLHLCDLGQKNADTYFW